MNEMYELLFEGVDETDLFPLLEFSLSKKRTMVSFQQWASLLTFIMKKQIRK